ncbi:LacI family DNA-binding transcriptional regulator [Sphingomonas colocasiae]|uniref:LacI family DNA-binding transcriptional regulator n=1 Tax=Sphingomonas colocasiae TaxID=1848973 RepID=A0ABS7PKF4_9SPHN|nr:LacI family DNA-binding transcriptional regulator [Sphingomonas colocasiae]MBY8821479.1 LacI family DNA-binding transcriptional regulator [Sphingomonas colocasiae]
MADNGRVTMADVARIAGVSKITVSRALSGSELVRPEVRDRIRKAAAAAGYRINLAARDLRLRQRRRVAVVIDMSATDDRPMSDPYPLALLGGIVQECAVAGFAVVLTTSDPRMSAEVQDASGIIVLGQGSHHHAVRALAAHDVPMVVWGADDGVESALGVVVIGGDNRRGGELAAEHMRAHGRQSLIFLGDSSHAELAGRLDGFRTGIAEHGGRLVAARSSGFTIESGAAAMASLIAQGIAFDGVFAGSDLVAIGAMRAMREHGLLPGRDVSVVGYDDSPAAAAHVPPLTSIRQDWTEGGRLLASTLLASLEPDTAPPVSARIVSASLIGRQT